MSKSKGIWYQDRGFFAYDVALGVLLKYVIDVAEARPSGAESAWLQEVISHWKVEAWAQDLSIWIDEDWSASQTAIFASLVEAACTRLEARKSISSLEIESWEFVDDQYICTRGATEVETGPVVELGGAILALIDGTLAEPPEGKNWYYGFPDGLDCL